MLTFWNIVTFLYFVNICWGSTPLKEGEDFSVAIPDEDLDNIKSVSKRFRRFSTEKKTVSLTQANCQVINTVVDLDLPHEKGISYYPTCVLVPRCGGCCLLEHFSCKPAKKETVRVKVMKINSSEVRIQRRKLRNRRRKVSNIITLEVDSHEECECGCKIKEKECNPSIHIYDELSCICECRNSDEKESCSERAQRYWDENTCRCLHQ